MIKNKDGMHDKCFITNKIICTSLKLILLLIIIYFNLKKKIMCLGKKQVRTTCIVSLWRSVFWTVWMTTMKSVPSMGACPHALWWVRMGLLGHCTLLRRFCSVTLTPAFWLVQQIPWPWSNWWVKGHLERYTRENSERYAS